MIDLTTRCGYAVIDRHGDLEPCGGSATGYRWYQDTGEHEDLLDVACEVHENPGGNRMAATEADRDRARSIAVALEQENAALEGEVDGRDGLINYYADLAHERDLLLGVARDTLARFRAEAEAAHGVIEQLGLLVEDWDHGSPQDFPGDSDYQIQRILDGATFEEVRNG